MSASFVLKLVVLAAVATTAYVIQSLVADIGPTARDGAARSQYLADGAGLR